jgi:hypothetical protein
MEDVRNAHKILVGKPEDHSEDLRIDGKMISSWILGK